MPQRMKGDDGKIVDFLKQFLNLQRATQPGTKYCIDCGSICVQMPADFWLEGDEETFRICLPLCPNCNPEFFARMAGSPEDS